MKGNIKTLNFCPQKTISLENKLDFRNLPKARELKNILKKMN